MLSRWISLNGVSRTTSISFLPSFRQTLADRVMRSSQNPVRIAESVFIEPATPPNSRLVNEERARRTSSIRGRDAQGMTIMPSCRKDPLEGAAAMSFML